MTKNIIFTKINRELNEIFKNLAYLIFHIFYAVFSFLPFFLIIQKNTHQNYFYIQYLIVLNIFFFNNIITTSVNFFLKKLIKKKQYILIRPINLPLFVLFNQIGLKNPILIILNISISLLFLKINLINYFLALINIFFWLIIINQFSIFLKIYIKVDLVPSQIFNLAKIPIELYSNSLKYLLFNIIPLGIVVYFPINTIIKNTVNLSIIYIILIQFIIMTINNYLVKISIKSYDY